MPKNARCTTKVSKNQDTKRLRPALTEDAREQQLISLATNLAEQQLLDGTASSQVITHFLKMGSSKEKLEKEILELQTDLIKAKTAALESTKNIENLYKEAMLAMQSYRGIDSDES